MKGFPRSEFRKGVSVRLIQGLAVGFRGQGVEGAWGLEFRILRAQGFGHMTMTKKGAHRDRREKGAKTHQEDAQRSRAQRRHTRATENKQEEVRQACTGSKGTRKNSNRGVGA